MRRLFIIVLFGTLSLALGCGGGSNSSSSTSTNTVAGAANNVQPIVVDSGPTAAVNANGGPDVDAAFVTVIVCFPNSTTNCATIDHVLVDTGSVGLRVFASELGSVVLPGTTSGGNPVAECTQFIDGSFLWGPVVTADVKIAGEVASSAPINLIGDSSFAFAVPASCSAGGNDNDSVATFGANGVLGVGGYPNDCGEGCANGVPSGDPYYTCPSSGCVQSSLSVPQQVPNPVSLFAADNNGVIIELPAVGSPQPSVTGSLVFGIGTQSNNGLGSATVLTVDPSNDSFSTNLNGVANMTSSFIDSGSNAYFFDDNNLANTCSVNTDFYCPPTPATLTAVDTGTNGATESVSFGVTNADSVFNQFPNDAAIPGLAGAGPDGGAFTSFDWGLPFFFDRHVFTSIYGTSAPGGQTPYWAF